MSPLIHLQATSNIVVFRSDIQAIRVRAFRHSFFLKDKSGVGIIVDKMKDHVVVNGLKYIFPSFSLFSLRNCMFQSAKCAK